MDESMTPLDRIYNLDIDMHRIIGHRRVQPVRVAIIVIMIGHRPAEAKVADLREQLSELSDRLALDRQHVMVLSGDEAMLRAAQRYTRP